MSKAQQTISLCMIVRNEERFIGQCLASVNDSVDDIVVVDTGSEDRTIEIAREFGARVFCHPWTEDFSEARNHAIAHSTSDWILMLDADETLAPRDAGQLRPLIQSAAVHGFSLIQRNYLRNANFVCASPNPKNYAEGHEYSDCLDIHVIRLFRNEERIRYQGRVHELVEPVFAARRLASATTDLVIHHFGKVGDSARLETKKRTYLDLGRRKAAEAPTDPMAQFELGVQLYELEQYKECVPYFEASLKLNPAFDIALLYIAKACHMSGEMKQAGAYFQKSLKRGPGNDRVLFDYANFVRDQGHFSEATKLYQRALLANPRNSLALFNMGVVDVRMDETERGMKSIERAIRLNPENSSFHEHLGRLPLKGPHLETAAHALEQYVERFPDAHECRTVLADVYFRLQRFEKARTLANGVLQARPDELGSMLVKAHSEFSLGHLDEADATYRSVLLLEPAHLDSMMNLAAIAEHRREYVMAISWYTRIVEKQQDHPQALKRYVVAHARSGTGNAEPGILERACSANPDDRQCMLLAGGLMEQLGQRERAAALYRSAGQRKKEWAAIVERNLQRLGTSQANPTTTASGEQMPDTASERSQQRRATPCPS